LLSQIIDNGTKKNLALLCVGLKRKDESNYLVTFIENYPLGHRHLRFSFFNHNLKERKKSISQFKKGI
tara:strand:- start:671 stop:874 length:204 start_codon:yes stop_codon:yes gene_type:complete